MKRGIIASVYGTLSAASFTGIPYKEIIKLIGIASVLRPEAERLEKDIEALRRHIAEEQVPALQKEAAQKKESGDEAGYADVVRRIRDINDTFLKSSAELHEQDVALEFEKISGETFELLLKANENSSSMNIGRLTFLYQSIVC